MVDATADKENKSYRMQMIQPETMWAANRRVKESAKRRCASSFLTDGHQVLIKQ